MLHKATKHKISLPYRISLANYSAKKSGTNLQRNYNFMQAFNCSIDGHVRQREIKLATKHFQPSLLILFTFPSVSNAWWAPLSSTDSASSKIPLVKCALAPGRQYPYLRSRSSIFKQDLNYKVFSSLINQLISANLLYNTHHSAACFFICSKLIHGRLSSAIGHSKQK